MFQRTLLARCLDKRVLSVNERDTYSAMHCRLVFMNTCNKGVSQKQAHRHREQTCSCQGRGKDGLGVWD